MSIEEKLRETIDDIIMLKGKLTALRIDYYSLQQSVSEDKTWHDKYLDAIRERDQSFKLFQTQQAHTAKLIKTLERIANQGATWGAAVDLQDAATKAIAEYNSDGSY